MEELPEKNNRKPPSILSGILDVMKEASRDPAGIEEPGRIGRPDAVAGWKESFERGK